MMTARQLLSILRLAQAHARVFLRDVVTEEDVDEALRLLRMSKSSIADNDEDFFTTEDIFSRIYILIREEAVKRKTNTLKYSEIEPIIIRFGFNRDQLDVCSDGLTIISSNVYAFIWTWIFGNWVKTRLRWPLHRHKDATLSMCSFM